jgi:DNA-binding transcriptional LysR family regulator
MLAEYQGEATPLYLVCPHRQMLSPAVTKLREMLVERFRELSDN